MEFYFVKIELDLRIHQILEIFEESSAEIIENRLKVSKAGLY